MARVFLMVAGGVTATPVDVAGVATYPAAGVDVSGVTGDPILYVRFTRIRGTFQVHLEDSLDSFSNNVIRKTWNVQGPIGANATEVTAAGVSLADKKQQELMFSMVLPRDCPGARYGITSSLMRLETVEATADADGLSECFVQAWLEY